MEAPRMTALIEFLLVGEAVTVGIAGRAVRP